MKKILSFFVCFISLFILIGCSSNNGDKKRMYTLIAHYGNQASEKITINEGNFVYTSNLELPSSLSSSYIIEGWYTDSNYSTKVDSVIRIRSNLDIYAKLVSFKGLADFTYGKGIDKEKVLNYFTINGSCITIDSMMTIDKAIAYNYQQKGYGDSFYRIKSSENLSNSLRREREVLYFPQGDLLLVSFSTTETSSIATLYYSYQYSGSIEIALGKKLNEAIYNGTYYQSCVNGYSYNIASEYTAKFVFNPSKVNPVTMRFGAFGTCKYTYSITNATDYSAAQRNFDANQSGEKCYSRLDGCLNYLDDMLQKIDPSYKIIQ